MRKRVWSLLLVCCMILTLCPLSAFANEDAELVTSKAVSESVDTSTVEADMGESGDTVANTEAEPVIDIEVSDQRKSRKQRKPSCLLMRIRRLSISV